MGSVSTSSNGHAEAEGSARRLAACVRAALLGAFAAFALGGCGALTNACNDRGVPTQWTECGNWKADDEPRLWTGEAERKGPVINTTKVNAESAPLAEITGYVGTLRIEIKPDPAQTANDVAEIAAAGNPNFDAEGVVSINFDNATIPDVLKQMLGGVLGVTYVAPDPMPGTITFHTEKPIPRAQVLAVLRDLLGRNGLVVRYFSGVYQVGSADAMAAIETNSRSGRAGEVVTRVVKLPRGGANTMATLLTQISPPGVTILPTAAQDAIVIRAPASDAAQVQDLMNTLTSRGITEDRVAIVPLRQSEPMQIATQVMAVYSAQMPAGAVTVIPLMTQRALLVSTRDPGLLNGLRKLVAEMDYSVADTPSLRIIALQHLKAEEIAVQLSNIFGAVSVSQTVVKQTDRGLVIRDRQTAQGGSDGSPPPPLNNGFGNFNNNNRPLAPDIDEDGGGLNVPGMMLPQGGFNGGGFGGGGGVGGGPVVAGGGGGGAGGGDGDTTRIVADPRSNSLMVYSTYTLFKRIQDVVRTLDVPQAQVVIEATVVEVLLNDELQRGVQWYLEGAGFVARSSVDPEPGDPGRSGATVVIGGSIGDVNVDVVLTALQEVTKVKVISSPYLTVVDGKSARLVVGDQIPYKTSEQTSSTTGGTTITESVEIKDTGIILEVTPKINANNSVDLKVKQSVTTPSQSVKEGNQQPIIATRDIQSDILVQSGRTVLLGGMIQDRLDTTEQGVPGIRSWPLIGDLFKSQLNKMQRVELLVMITPRVVRHSTQIEEITRQLRIDTQTGYGRQPAIPKAVVVQPAFPPPVYPAPVAAPPPVYYPPATPPKVTKP